METKTFFVPENNRHKFPSNDTDISIINENERRQDINKRDVIHHFGYSFAEKRHLEFGVKSRL